MALLEPFYCSLRQLSLGQVPWNTAHGQSLYCGEYCAQSKDQGTVPHIFISFAPVTADSSLDGGTVNLCINGDLYSEVPLSTLNISSFLSYTEKNHFMVWGDSLRKEVVVNIVEAMKVSEADMLRSLGETAPYTITQEDTKALVRAFLEDADEATVENLQVSLICPIAKRKIRVPCRGARCQHVQCFDGYAYLGLNEGTLYPWWCCPICDCRILLKDIRVDLFTLDILRKADEQCSAVNLLADATWVPATDRDDHSIIVIEDSPVKELRKHLQDLSIVDLTVDSD